MNREQKTITDAAAADFLTNPEMRNLLGPFMSQKSTMSEAAKELGVELNTLHRRVGQMLDLGLLEVTREDVRDGHRVKLYRATRSEYIVPIEATTQIDLETLTETGFKQSASMLGRGVARAMERACPRWGFKIYVE